MSLTSGARVGPYEILQRIGAGGMGEVYRARDTRLEREIAIKVLPDRVASDPHQLARFEREAQLLASLNHPHIVTIHSIEQIGALRFLTMELVDGQSLDRLIPATGMEVGQLLAIAISVADACASAHDKGIIHRDLKPANVMVEATGRVKVLDFGLAKIADTSEAAGGEATRTVTRAGIVLGTVPYMSPEQAEGLPVDHRSDIFSLGVLLYEMATGSRPFHGATSPALLSAILKDTPRPVTELRRDLPQDVERLINGCLAKSAAERIQTARDVHVDLSEIRRSAAAGIERDGVPRGIPRVQTDTPWIVVMPFTQRRSDPELQAFADSLAEDVSDSLSRFSYLMVISHSATLGLKDAVDLRSAGAKLGARYVLEGSVRQAGPMIRVNVRLVEVKTATQLWTETYDRTVTAADILDMQDEISERIVATVADAYGVLTRSMGAPLMAKTPDLLTPYEAVLRFFLFQQRRSPADHLVTRSALERAVEQEPYYADAWACLTTVLVDEYRHFFNPRPDPLDRALAAARRAVDAGPANQLAHAALAEAFYFRQDLGAFRAAAERAIAINPRDSNTMGVLGLWMGYAGDWERACALTSRARELNPTAPGWYRYAAYFQHYRREEYEEALAVAEQINMPDYFTTHSALAAAHAQLGHTTAARAAADEVLRLAPTFPEDGQLQLERFIFSQPQLVERFIDGLRKAGLPMARRQ